MIGGIINLGFPHSMISVAQKWVPTASIQLVQPIATTAGSIFSHFVLPDEPFTTQKFYSLLSAFTGVGLSAAAPFNHATEAKGATMEQVAIGFVFLIIGVSGFGIAAVYLKWKTPNTDLTISSFLQTLGSTLFCLVWALVFDGPTKMKTMISNAPTSSYFWPLLVGVEGTCAAVHGIMYLIGTLGAVMANFVTFGQIIVGVAIGVTLLGEWKLYFWWEVVMNAIGIIFLASAIFIGFYQPKSKEITPKETDEHSETNAPEHEIISEL